MATFRATADNQTLDGTVDADEMYGDFFESVTLNGGGGNDTIYGAVFGGEFNGGLGDDRLYTDREYSSSYDGIFNGNEGNDYFSSFESYNTIFNGGEGDDRFNFTYVWTGTFNGGAGDDEITLIDFGTYEGSVSIENDDNIIVDGGDDNDTAKFWQPISNFSFVKESGAAFITDAAAAGHTTIAFINIETFQFWNGSSFIDYTFDEIPCFLPGTLIATPSGDVAIETLKAGDLVLTTEGEARPVRWLARQTVSTRFANPQRVMPILVRAGALGMGVPARDLYVSPDHALFLDGLLVHAEALVNGSSIVRHTAMPERFTYYHVELDDHSLILAEGAPVETFIDNVTRRSFDNWQEAPDAPVAAELELPRVKSARQLPRSIRNLLAMRAKALGAIAAA